MGIDRMYAKSSTVNPNTENDGVELRSSDVSSATQISLWGNSGMMEIFNFGSSYLINTKLFDNSCGLLEMFL